jgi:hypothetical protein
LTHAERLALKAATRAAVQAGGGQEAVVRFTRLSRPQALSDHGNPAEDGRFMPIDVVADVEALTHGTPGFPAITRTLARLHGFDLVPMPRARGEAADYCQHLQAIVRETADVTLELSLHLMKPPSEREAARLIREVDQAQQALAELKATLADGGEG